MVMLILGLDLAGRMFTSLALIRDFELISDFAGSDKSDFNQLRQLIQEICHIRAGQFGFDRVSAVLKRGEFIRAKLSIDTFYQLYTGTDRVKVRQAKILNGLLNIILSSNPEQCRQGIWELLITFDEILLSGYMQLYWKFPSDFEKYQQLLEMRKSYWQKNLALEKGWFYPTSGKSPITVADEELLLNYHKGREAKLFSGLWRIVGYSVGIRTKWVLNITLAFTAFGGFGLFILLIKLNLLGAVDLTVPSYAHSSSSFYLLLYSPLLLSTIGASWIFGWQLFMNPVTRFGISNEISFIVKLGLALFIICIVLVLPFVAWSDNSYATARLSSVAFLDTSSRGMTQLNREGGLEKIDFETLRVQAISEHFGPEAWMLATSSNDRFAAVWLNSQIKIWDWNSQKEFASLPYNEKDEVILSAAFSPDSSFLMIIGFSKNTSNSISPLDFVIRTWSLKDFTLTVILRESTETVNKYAAGFNPNGTILAFGGFHRDLILWNSTSYKEIGHLKQPIQELVQQSVEVVDSDFDISKAVTSLAFSQDSKIVAAGTYDGYIYIWDVATTKLLRVLVGHYGRINSLRFDPQTQSLISTSSDLTMKFWRLDNTND
jgi:WD40 repeat protein